MHDVGVLRDLQVYVAWRTICSNLAPEFFADHALFEISVHLEKMCVRNVACRNLSIACVRLPAMRVLTDLDLSFGSDLSFGGVLHSMCLPALETCKFAGDTNEEAEALALYGSVLATVTTFILQGDFDERDLMVRVFLHMPFLLFLDLPSSEFAVLEALLAADNFFSDRSRTRCVACPNLSVVAVRNLPPDLVAAFISPRAARSGRLSEVIFREGFRSGVNIPKT
ncbi:hypothetical protein DFH09DRAFT_1305270 [Mycena vulgaris]|nr:hypothetical protein DFH09DRAFT_1305270 [Mycena vulgaris]